MEKEELRESVSTGRLDCGFLFPASFPEAGATPAPEGSIRLLCSQRTVLDAFFREKLAARLLSLSAPSLAAGIAGYYGFPGGEEELQDRFSAWYEDGELYSFTFESVEGTPAPEEGILLSSLLSPPAFGREPFSKEKPGSSPGAGRRFFLPAAGFPSGAAAVLPCFSIYSGFPSADKCLFPRHHTFLYLVCSPLVSSIPFRGGSPGLCLSALSWRFPSSSCVFRLSDPVPHFSGYHRFPAAAGTPPLAASSLLALSPL